MVFSFLLTIDGMVALIQKMEVIIKVETRNECIDKETVNYYF